MRLQLLKVQTVVVLVTKTLTFSKFDLFNKASRLIYLIYTKVFQSADTSGLYFPGVLTVTWVNAVSLKILMVPTCVSILIFFG